MAEPDASTLALVGRVLCGRYRVDGLLGAGGMGSVLRATHTGTGRAVAVKVMRPELTRDGELVRRFHQEARAAAAVSRKGVVEVLDFDTDAEVGPILVLELLEGESMHARIVRTRGLAPAEAARIAIHVLDTLCEVHAKGIVHRDLKPANVFLARDEDGERVKLVDFGIARVESAMRTRALTVPGTALGTPRYMAPEQARGEPDVDARADLYAVGAILYFALAGRPPFAELASEEVLSAVLTASPAPLERLRPDVPPALAAVVARAMARDRGERFQRADEMRDALVAASAPAAAPSPSAQRAPALGVASSPSRGAAPWRTLLIVAAGVGAVVILGGLAVAAVGMWRRPVEVVAVGAAATPPTQAESLAFRLQVALAAARSSLAAGDPNAARRTLADATSAARGAGVARGHPAASALVEAQVLTAVTYWRMFPTAGPCDVRAEMASNVTKNADEQVDLARAVGVQQPLGCALVELADVEVATARTLDGVTGADRETCARGARTVMAHSRSLAALAASLPAHACSDRAREAAMIAPISPEVVDPWASSDPAVPRPRARQLRVADLTRPRDAEARPLQVPDFARPRDAGARRGRIRSPEVVDPWAAH